MRKEIYDRYENIIAKFEKDSSSYFQRAAKDEIERMKNLHGWLANKNCIYREEELEDIKNYVIPKSVIYFYENYSPFDTIDLGADINLLSTSKMEEENCELVPGAYLIKYGFLTFATTTGGNAICMDLNKIKNDEPRIVISDHSIFNDKEISIYENGVINTENLSYDSINRYSVEVSDSFISLLNMAIEGKIDDIEDFLE